MYKTDRLVLRQWTDSDREPFAAMNQCQKVMRYFPRLFTTGESNAFIDVNHRLIDDQGWGAWAVETQITQEFIGYVGFSRPEAWHPCADDIEIGWRLSHQFWQQGYATEAARCALNIGFTRKKFEEIVSFTSAINTPSISVMRRLGMIKDAKGFKHPRINDADPLCEHVIYRKTHPGDVP